MKNKRYTNQLEKKSYKDKYRSTKDRRYLKKILKFISLTFFY